MSDLGAFECIISDKQNEKKKVFVIFCHAVSVRKQNKTTT